MLTLAILAFTLAVSSMLVTGEMSTGQGLALDDFFLVLLHVSKAFGTSFGVEHVQSDVAFVDGFTVAKVFVLTVFRLV